MNPIYMLTAMLMKKDEQEKMATCPNCGLRQRSNVSAKFVCTQCQYRIPHFKSSIEPSKTFSLNLVYEFIFILLGPALAFVGLKGFLIPNGLIDGGVTGISMLLSKIMNVDLAFFLILINLPFIVSSYHQFSKEFAFRAIFSIVLLAVFLYFIKIPIITNDLLLDAIFGGFFLGAGIAFSIRGGGVLDGTEVLALIVSRRFPATVGDSILFFNILIFSSALFFLPSKEVLYSILTYFSASKTVDFMMHGIESYNGFFVISANSHQIRFSLVNSFGKGGTIIKSKGGFSEKEQEILFFVLTRLEIKKMKKIIEGIDKDAFIVVFPISDVRGGIIKKILYEKQI